MLPPTVRELVPDEHAALDGTKVEANASRHKAMNYGRMQQTEPRVAAEVAGWFEDAERTTPKATSRTATARDNSCCVVLRMSRASGAWPAPPPDFLKPAP